VQSILNRSKAIKTNRLFLFLANYYEHPWISRIDETQIKLGAGKRQVKDRPEEACCLLQRANWEYFLETLLIYEMSFQEMF
jgi:hypothetical protein